MSFERIRKGLGLTQAAVARLFQVDQATVSRWERGTVTPPPEAQAKINALPALAAAEKELPASRAELLALLKQTDAALTEVSAKHLRYRYDHLCLEVPSMRYVVRPGTPTSEVDPIRERSGELQLEVETLSARLNQILIRLSLTPEKKGTQ
jgi:transcriptional regulator with XRE-family HTH domain